MVREIREGTSWYKNRVRNGGAVEWEEPGWILVCRGCETPVRPRPTCASARARPPRPRVSVMARGFQVGAVGTRAWGGELEPRRIRTGSGAGAMPGGPAWRRGWLRLPFWLELQLAAGCCYSRTYGTTKTKERAGPTGTVLLDPYVSRRL